MGLRSTVLLERALKSAAPSEQNGTPCAILVDKEGRVASELAVGGPRRLSLLGAAGTSGSADGGAPSDPASATRSPRSSFAPSTGAG